MNNMIPNSWVNSNGSYLKPGRRMIVVMQCAGLKMPDAGLMRRAVGRKVKLVAHPDTSAPRDEFYAHPDDDSGMGATWRALLLRYNESPGNNPLGLLRVSRFTETKFIGVSLTASASKIFSSCRLDGG